MLPIIPGYSIEIADPAFNYAIPHLRLEKLNGPCEGEVMGYEREKFLRLGITTREEMDEFWSREF